MYGTIQINNKTFAEREQNFPFEVTVAAAGVQKFSLPLPGVANFLLKALMRETVVAGASTARRFRARLGNTDGSTYYSSSPVGGTTDRVIDTLMFGSGQFPFVLNPYIYYSASASILLETEDISGSFPYTIFFNFRGSYLFEVPGQN